MKITIDVSTMQNRFAACGRDYYSWEGYEALLIGCKTLCCAAAPVLAAVH